MHIEIDFEVFKALTAMRHSEADTHNEVIRRLLSLPSNDLEPRGLGSLLSGMPGHMDGPGKPIEGIWFNDVFFQEGTEFRATYKGRTYFAKIVDGRWIGQDGIARTSPSDAASSISSTNVNGWRFWFVKRPKDENWSRMDELRR